MSALRDKGFTYWRRLTVLSLGLGLVACAIAAYFHLQPSRQPARAVDAPDRDRGKAGSAGSIVFEERTQASGLHFTHLLAQPEAYYFPDIMSPGAALFDLNNDGRLDIFLLNGSREFPHRPVGPLMPRAKAPAGSEGNRLFQQAPDGRFIDATESSGLGESHYGSGVAAGDVNNDGWPDVYVTNVGDDQLYLNLGNGTFANVTQDAGIRNPLWGTSVGFVDFDRDGWLDIFVVNYVDYHASHRCENRHGREDYCTPNLFAPTCAKLYRNVTGALGSAGSARVKFEDVSDSSGIASLPGPGLGVLFADFNDDDWPDIYVANDDAPNFVWINQHNGKFRDEAVVRGVATDGQGRPQSSMGVAYGDVDRDGLDDLFMTHFSGEHNTLYRQVERGGVFTDHTAAANLFENTFQHTGFGVVFCDLDHDGDLDIVVANGHVKRQTQSPVAPGASFNSVYGDPNQVLLNDGAGRFHEDLDPRCPFRGPTEVSRGLACGDIDGDGALDFLVTNGGGPARLYFNRTPGRGNWLIVRAVEPRFGGRDAYGAVVTVVAGGASQQRVINSTFSYLSASDPRVHFGLGSAGEVERIVVRWPDGSREVFPGGGVNRSLVLSHGEGAAP